MGIPSLTSRMSLSFNVNAAFTPTPSNLGQTVNESSPLMTMSISTAAANAAVGGGDEFASNIITVTASSSATLDLTSVQNILQTAGVTLARAKEIAFALLSSSNTTPAYDSVNGTLAASVTLGNNGSNDFISQSGSGWLGSASSTFVIPNGAVMGFMTPSAAGVVVDSTHKIEKITNNDGALTAACQYFLGGGST